MNTRRSLAQFRQSVQASAGFTLMESVVVILLLSILAAYVVPKAFSTSSLTLEAQASTLAADLQRAQNLAATSGQTVLVCIGPSLNPNTYLLQQGGSCPSTLPANQTTEPVFVVLGNGVIFTKRPALSYNSMGQPSNVADFQIKASDSANSYTVSVAALSGLVSIAKP